MINKMPEGDSCEPGGPPMSRRGTKTETEPDPCVNICVQVHYLSGWLDCLALPRTHSTFVNIKYSNMRAHMQTATWLVTSTQALFKQ